MFMLGNENTKEKKSPASPCVRTCIARLYSTSEKLATPREVEKEKKTRPAHACVFEKTHLQATYPASRDPSVVRPYACTARTDSSYVA
jgi:hypothetical protein